MINQALKHYYLNRDASIRHEYPNGYGKHNKKVVLTVCNGEPVAEVYLNDTNFMLIDIASLSLLEANPFIAHPRNDKQHCARANGTSRAYFHRLVIDNCDNLEVDHINHNPLDNRLSNLRVCSAKQNNIAKRNSRINQRLNTGFIGVYHANEWDCDKPAIYKVVHPVEGVYTDEFSCEWEAAEYRDKKVEWHFLGESHGGEWLTLNFIKWNYEPEVNGATYDAAINYNGHNKHTCQNQLGEGIEWLRQQEWTRPFYGSYIAKYNVED